MIKKLLLLGGIWGGLVWGQSPPPFNLQISQQPLPPVVNMFANYTGAIGQTTNFYWVVARYQVGNSALSAPTQVNGIASTGSVAIGWNAPASPSGYTLTYDVLRTTSATFPANGTCVSCLVSNATTNTTATDSLGALSNYSLNTYNAPSPVNLTLDNINSNQVLLQGIVNGSPIFQTPLILGKTFTSLGNAISGKIVNISALTQGVGMVNTTATSTAVTGVGTFFTDTFQIGNAITVNGETRTVATITSDIALTTDAWTNTNAGASFVVGYPFTDRFRILSNGAILLANSPLPGTATDILTVSPTFNTSISSNLRVINVTPTINSTIASSAAITNAINATLTIGPTNTSNFTSTNVAAINASFTIQAGATGAFTQATGVRSLFNLATGVAASVTTAYHFHGLNAAGATRPTNYAGIAIDTLGGTNNTFLLLGGTGVVPAGNFAINDSSGFLSTLTGVQSVGTKFTATGCTNSATLGGATSGQYTSGTTGVCTVVITMNGATGLTATNGWYCQANDTTTAADTVHQIAPISTTQATLSGTTASGDVITFGCTGY